MTKSISRICLIPKYLSVSGPASFQRKFSKGMAEHGIEVTNDLDDQPYDVVLVSGGSRQLVKIRQAARRRGIPIIQRLDGINWTHRKVWTGLRHYIKSEYSNLLISYIREREANKIIYQSEFVRGRWESVYGPVRVPHQVTLNGVDLDTYTPDGPHQRSDSIYRIMLVEGAFGGGHEFNLEIAVGLAEELHHKHNLPVELMIAGRVPEKTKNEWDHRAAVPLKWAGVVPAEEIPTYHRSAHLFFSAELNAPCPNSVIEALACGLPVAAFDTGSLGEIVQGQAGEVIPYGGDPWNFDQPDIPALAQAAVKILNDQETYRKGARARAEAAFGLDMMIDGYLKALTSD